MSPPHFFVFTAATDAANYRIFNAAKLDYSSQLSIRVLRNFPNIQNWALLNSNTVWGT